MRAGRRGDGARWLAPWARPEPVQAGPSRLKNRLGLSRPMLVCNANVPTMVLTGPHMGRVGHASAKRSPVGRGGGSGPWWRLCTGDGRRAQVRLCLRDWGTPLRGGVGYGVTQVTHEGGPCSRRRARSIGVSALRCGEAVTAHRDLLQLSESRSDALSNSRLLARSSCTMDHLSHRPTGQVSSACRPRTLPLF